MIYNTLAYFDFKTIKKELDILGFKLGLELPDSALSSQRSVAKKDKRIFQNAFLCEKHGLALALEIQYVLPADFLGYERKYQNVQVCEIVIGLGILTFCQFDGDFPSKI